MKTLGALDKQLKYKLFSFTELWVVVEVNKKRSLNHFINTIFKRIKKQISYIVDLIVRIKTGFCLVQKLLLIVGNVLFLRVTNILTVFQNVPHD